MKNIVSESIDELLEHHERAENIGKIALDSESTAKWRNYHLIGDVIRGDVQSTGNCLVGKIENVLAAEPTLLAPVAAEDRIITSENQRSDVWKSAGMFAVAASVALFAVVGLTPGLNPGLNPVSNSGGDIAGVTSQEPNTVAASSAQDEFGQLLVEHGEFTATTGMNGLLSYAKLVSNQQIEQ